jgi:predicted glycosyltransferase
MMASSTSFPVQAASRATSPPGLLLYCQHSLGMGHLVRSLALAAGLATRFRVVFLNGGPLPRGIERPPGVELVALPPLGQGPDGRLVSRDRRRSVDRVQALRRGMILETFRALRPAVVLIELFPFGRKKFADELVPLLEAARAGAGRPLILCSLRDILVGRPGEQQKHDDRAVALANRYFDGILVHSDPKFARLEESFCPRSPLQVPVHYTGFVTPKPKPGRGAAPVRRRTIVVSAGGGLVGEPLLRAAIEAHALLADTELWPMNVIAGPFMPDEAWRSLREAARGRKGLRLRKYVPDLCGELRSAAASVSQCGYNTALDILRAAVPALVVPFAEGHEDEQTRRARRLAQLGVVRVLEPQRLDAATLATEIDTLLRFRPRVVELDLNGTQNSAELVASLVRTRSSRAMVRTAEGARQ